MQIIENNPYRIFGTYANSAKKDIAANKSKAEAFLKVNRAVTFPLDLNGVMSSLTRTSDMISEAESRLSITKEQVKYAQFWFLKMTSLDDVAFNHLIAGNISKAVEIWDKQDSISSLQNKMICSLIDENDSLIDAVYLAEQLYNEYGDVYLNELGFGDTLQMSKEDLVCQFLDSLKEEGVDLTFLLGKHLGNDWEDYIKKQYVTPIINKILTEINAAEKVSKSNSEARRCAGWTLINNTEQELSKLKVLLDVDDSQYQVIADKLGLEILQCGIDYFNESEDDDAPQKAMGLQKRALSIVVGAHAEQRCGENVKILADIGPEYAVRKELACVTSCIKRIKGENNSLYVTKGLNAKTVEENINQCRINLNTIKAKLGSSNTLYVNISSAVVAAVVNAIVEAVNEEQTFSFLNTDKSALKKLVSESLSIMTSLSYFDTDAKTKDYYNKNKKALSDINSKLNPAGCYIATMAYGSYEHPQVIVLRNFRDNYLSNRNWGQKFIKFYYKYSPLWVERLKDHKFINSIIRGGLDCFVACLKKMNKYE